MINDMKKQTGVTLIGLVFILGTIALVVLFVLRAFPLYNEKFQVTAAINSVASKADPESVTEAQIRKAFQANILASSNIRRFTDAKYTRETVSLIKPKKRSEPKLLNVKYQLTNALVSDLQLLMEIDISVPIGGPTG